MDGLDGLKEARLEREYLVGLRRYFHQHPEISLREEGTARRIEAELDALSIPHRRIGETGVLGVLKGGRAGDRVIALRADIDALPVTEEKEEAYRSQNPGVMHACGHDMHTASLLGAARLLAARRAEFGGEIRLLFQQAEEVGQGARAFLKAGALEGVCRVFGIHAASNVPVGSVAVTPGPVNASCDYFKIVVHGKAAHVSTPQKGVDALYAASQIAVALQAIVSRQSDPIDTVVVGVGRLEAGSAYNVIAEKAVLEGTTRAFRPDTRERIAGSVASIAQGIAAVSGATAEVLFEAFAPPLVNDPAVCGEVSASAAKLVGGARVIRDREKSLGADDFAELLLKAPGVYAYVGTGNPEKPNTVLPHHCGRFDIDEDALVVAAALYAEVALDWLES